MVNKKKSDGHIKKEIIINPSMKESCRKKMSPFSRDFMAGDQMWSSEVMLRKLATNWENETWNNEEIDDPYEYLMSLGIRPSQARRWCEAYDFFREAYEAVKEIIFMRDYKKLKETNPEKREFMLPDYREEYKLVYEWKAGLKNQPNGVPSQQIPNPVQYPLDDKVKS